jgi:hypothetical protein
MNLQEMMCQDLQGSKTVFSFNLTAYKTIVYRENAKAMELDLE